MNPQTTPLIIAAEQGDVSKVKQLLADGADVAATDYLGYSAVDRAMLILDGGKVIQAIYDHMHKDDDRNK